MSGVDIAGLVEELKDWYENWSLGSRGPEILNRAADALLAQAAEVEKLTARLSFALDEGTSWAVKTGLASRQRDKALAAIKAAREALEPFAKIYDESVRDWPADFSPHRDDNRHAWGFNGADLTWGDFRRARSVLENSKAPLADATNNPPSDPGTEQREAGR